MKAKINIFKNLILIVIIVVIAVGNICSCKFNSHNTSNSPYRTSPVIAKIKWDFDNMVYLAPGSDLWPVTWAADNNLYTSWGDGVGFGAKDMDEQWGPDRASFGFSRIEGSPGNFKATNVWGGKESENKATLKGKVPGILSVNGVLYAWLNLQNSEPPDLKLCWSNDFGANWNVSQWKFASGYGQFFPQAFLNFGKDYEGARDNFIYFYGRQWGETWSEGKTLFLGRVPKDKIIDRTQYEFFTGLDSNDKPKWVTDIKLRRPVVIDPNGIVSASVIYNKGINRYIMTTSRGKIGQFAVFDSPEPWGPWTTAAYYENWGQFEGYSLYYHFPTKWINKSGNEMWCIFSSNGYFDSFNLIKATLELKQMP